MPWQVIGVIHTMESSGDFSKHLHNGDPLTQRTVRVPRGRPTKSDPPFNWIDSAADALEYDGLDKAVADYATVGGILYWLESYNGFGYRDRGINSPYLWACTQHYDRGLYVSDGVFDANRRSDACGSGAMLQRMVERGEFEFAARRSTQHTGDDRLDRFGKPLTASSEAGLAANRPFVGDHLAVVRQAAGRDELHLAAQLGDRLQASRRPRQRGRRPERRTPPCSVITSCSPSRVDHEAQRAPSSGWRLRDLRHLLRDARTCP